MPLSDLRYLAQKSRDRIDRITKHAADLDQHGNEVEAKSHSILNQHEEVLVGVSHEIDKIDEFNRDMQQQLGNEPGDNSQPFHPKAAE